MSRILFITEVNKTLVYSGYISFSIMYLSAIAKKAGHQCDISAVDYDEAERTFREFRPDIVAYSAFTGPHMPMIGINKKLKQKFDFFSMFGGPHPTYFPEIIEEEESIDAICLGEGFEAFPNLVGKLDREEDITQTPNYWIRKDGKIYKNPVAPQVKSLDEIPFPDRSIFDKYPYYMKNKSFSFMASLGCPYKCTYCFNHLAQKMLCKGDKIVRWRSVDDVIREMKEVKEKYPMEYILFRDDIFIMNKKWIKEFSEKYSREIGLPFSCLARVDYITEEIIEDLKKANVFQIAIGIESGNDYLRKTVLKRNMSNEAILKAAKIMHDKKVAFSTYNIIGIPGETFEMALETWDINVKCRPSSTWSFLLFPYPRTDVYNYALENGYLDKDRAKDFLLSYHDESILNLKDKKELVNFHKLFSIAVEFPFLIPLIKIMVRLPFGGFYNVIRKLWKGYATRTRLYPSTVKSSFSETLSIVYDTLFKSKV